MNWEHGLLLTIVIAFLLVLGWVLSGMLGAGTLQSWTTIGGIYAVPKPGGYNAVCFVEKAHGGVSCLPFNTVQPPNGMSL